MRLRVLMVGSAAMVAAIAGCSSEGKNESSAAPSSAAASSEETATSSEPATSSSKASAGGSATTAEVTPAGTELKLGQTGTVPVKYADVTGPVSITVSAIDKGDPADLESLQLGEKAAGKVPYYIRATMRNASDTDLSGATISDLDGMLDTGRGAASVIEFGNFEKCNSKGAPKDFTTAGASFETCVIALADANGAVTAAVWTDSEGGYDDNPLIWKP